MSERDPKQPERDEEVVHVKVATYADLLLENHRAVTQKRNRWIEPEWLEEQPNDAVYPVTFSMLHEGVPGTHIRCAFGFPNSQLGWVDVDLAWFNKLQTVAVPKRLLKS